MILVDWQLKNLCEKEGLVDPFNPELVNPASLDIRIGYTIMIDTSQGYMPQELRHVTKEDPFYLHPGQFCLIASYEKLKLRNDLTASLYMKSSRAREGLTHALAGWIDPGFHGVLTLELKNYSQYSDVPIYPGMRIAQLVFHQVYEPTKNYNEGRYSGHNTVMQSLDAVSRATV